MNCAKCEEMLSEFLDAALNDADRAELAAHLQQCLPCYALNLELAAIANFYRECLDDSEIDALWFRIMQSLPEPEEGACPVKILPSPPLGVVDS